ncbi:NAD(P)-dependent oxidoreductase [Tissierella sp. Yu-01]|uniref:NAD(P)-dependent oxidoreductase n=1 Tax=Tissierella sp. Yu-01 TaxID=3035694 RepID=UPI00240D4399|nr:NAD(P)-dependent oxidoreductase [Tissierella sp. Yu-01]WFA08632.1 NAD(P)-dependent oxidoreductase [Tissierella sp. Yu-01]
MKIVVLEDLAIPESDIRNIAKSITDQGHELTLYQKTDNIELQKQYVKDADILVIANMPLKGEVIRAAENLKYISIAFTGFDHVDLEACKERNIQVSNAAGYATIAVPELVFGMAISLLRSVVTLDKKIRYGETKSGSRQQEIYGKNFGVIGTGTIGIRVAKIALAFGANVLAYSNRENEELKSLGVKYMPLDELLSISDIVSIHTPLLPETKGLINKDNIGLMKPSSILINTARGPVVDTAAITNALKEGRISGACLDVFDMEPPLSSGYQILTAPNTVLTPHIGFATEEAMVRRTDIIFNVNIANWLKGEHHNKVI